MVQERGRQEAGDTMTGEYLPCLQMRGHVFDLGITSALVCNPVISTALPSVNEMEAASK